MIVHNIKSFKHEEIDLYEYSLFIGKNNSGKSNLIYALRLFYDDVKYSKTDFPIFDTTDKESWIELHYKLENCEFDTLKDEYKTEDKVLKLRRYFASTDKELFDSKQSNIHAYESGKLSTNQFYGMRAVSRSKIGNLVYIPDVSKSSEQLKTSGPSPFRDIMNFVFKSVVKQSKEFVQLTKSFNTFEKLLKENKEDELSIKTVEADINDLIGDWGINFKIFFNELKPEDIVKNLVSHYFSDAELGDSQQKIEDFGQGFQRHLIYALINLTPKYQPVKAPKKKDFQSNLTLILFEEPEAFLHPSQQDTLNASLQDLANTQDNQVIITTHSTNFVSNNFADVKKNTHIKKEEGVSLTYHIDPNILSSGLGKLVAKLNEIKSNPETHEHLVKNIEKKLNFDIPEYYEILKLSFSVDSERAKMFFASKVLICEGATERNLILYLLDNDWSTIKNRDFFVLNAEGKYNIPKYMELLNEMGIKHSVWYDKDFINNKGNSADIGFWDIVNSFLDDEYQAYPFSKDRKIFDKDFEDFLGISKPPSNHLKPIHSIIEWQKDNIKEEKKNEIQEEFLKFLNL